MTFQQLLYFCKVAEVGSFTRASEVLYVSQPTLSQQIAKLERELSCLLFERSTNGVVLTSSGKILYEHGLRIIDELALAHHDLDRRRLGPAKVLSVGGIESFLVFALPAILSRYAERHPNVEVEIRSMSSQVVVDAIVGTRLHIGVLSSFTDFELLNEGGQVAMYPLARTPLVVVAPKSVNLADPVTLDALIQRDDLILFSKGHPVREILEQRCILDGIYLPPKYVVTAALQALTLVDRGLGIALMAQPAPEGTIQERFPNTKVYSLQPFIRRQLALAVGRRTAEAPCVNDLVSLIRDHFESQGVFIV